ncbi:trans-sulfuration enzyme family protein [Paenibacillus chartarius]|uniref:Trans-sulfuration enzyme family protein n=1 Tax=Paenibacillus chartarius TaxID=747481 RepID=A0ABV6DR45_9BACL
MDAWSQDIHICLHSGEDAERYEGASVPPIFENTHFVFPTFEEFVQAHRNESERYVYWRGTNPTVQIVERKLAMLERGERCKCFASGIGAMAAALLSCVQNGDHVIGVGHLYEETKKLLAYIERFGVTHSITRTTNVDEIERTIQPGTKVIVMESPTSLTFELVDLRRVAELAKSRRVTTIVDNTWATPLLQKPLELGIDIVVHSASKYMGGHSDFLGGAVIGGEAFIRKLFDHEYLLLGAALAPLEARMLLRGLRTLPVRLQAHRDGGMKVAQFLEDHPAVAVVRYPGLHSHPQYELGLQQMRWTTGLLGFELKEASYESVKKVLNRLKVFRIGFSWGSYESLAMSPNYGDNAAQLAAEGIGQGLIRISVGLEPVEELLEDLNQALQ